MKTITLRKLVYLKGFSQAGVPTGEVLTHRLKGGFLKRRSGGFTWVLGEMICPFDLFGG